MKSTFPRQLCQDIAEQLQAIYPSEESESLAQRVLEAVFSLDHTALLINAPLALSADKEKKIADIVFRLLKNEPIQHILGEADFYGRKFKVSPNVLVPRQETEQLVYLILETHKGSNPRVLDVGTGSGCIACTLALELKRAAVAALDVSAAALEIARENAEKLSANVDFYQVDVLTTPLPLPQLDIVVSNPPYVRESEKSAMHANVLAYDPHLALFVPDGDPLVFYKVIATKAWQTLSKGGKLYFEINEAFGVETATMIEIMGFSSVNIHQDLNGKDRFVSGVRL